MEQHFLNALNELMAAYNEATSISEGAAIREHIKSLKKTFCSVFKDKSLVYDTIEGEYHSQRKEA